MSPQPHQRGLLTASAPTALHLPYPHPLCTPEHSTEKNQTAPEHMWIHQEPTLVPGRGCTSSLSHPCPCPDILLMTSSSPLTYKALCWSKSAARGCCLYSGNCKSRQPCSSFKTWELHGMNPVSLLSKQGSSRRFLTAVKIRTK